MPPLPLFAAFDWSQFGQFAINGLSSGMLIALVALGYTMVYGIVELINFAHGDLFMLGGFMALTLLGLFGTGTATTVLGLIACLLAVPVFCAVLNHSVDRFVYKPLRNAPKLAPLVSAIGVSFVFMNVGLFWGGSQAVDFPDPIPNTNILETEPVRPLVETVIDVKKVQFTYKDLLVVGVTVPLMIALTIFVKFTRVGKAMRATAQNPVAAQLMGIDTDRVIGTTFLVGGALAGAGSVVYGLKLNTVHFQMGYTNGLYAFTAAVLGGIGNIPGAVLGGLLIGLILSLGSGYIGEQWKGALVFATLITILVFRPAGLLGARVREKV
jgi:branched-chain amino acid transport system permease protein